MSSWSATRMLTLGEFCCEALAEWERWSGEPRGRRSSNEPPVLAGVGLPLDGSGARGAKKCIPPRGSSRLLGVPVGAGLLLVDFEGVALRRRGALGLSLEGRGARGVLYLIPPRSVSSLVEMGVEPVVATPTSLSSRVSSPQFSGLV